MWCVYHFCTLCCPSSHSRLSPTFLPSGTPAPVHRSPLAGPLAEANDGPVVRGTRGTKRNILITHALNRRLRKGPELRMNGLCVAWVH